MIVRCVDIVGIVDHECLNFLFISEYVVIIYLSSIYSSIITNYSTINFIYIFRLKKYAGLTFYLSPSASLEGLTEISISVTFDTKLFDTNTDLPALVFWDKGKIVTRQ